MCNKMYNIKIYFYLGREPDSLIFQSVISERFVEKINFRIIILKYETSDFLKIVIYIDALMYLY